MTSTAREETIGAVIVAYWSDVAGLGKAVEHLVAEDIIVVVVDNTETTAAQSTIRNTCEHLGATYLSMGRNAGIAAAQNRGAKFLIDEGVAFVLLMDDDSTMPRGGPATLKRDLTTVKASNPKVVAIGPTIVDSRTGTTIAAAWEKNRVRPARTPIWEFTTAAYLLASGTLVEVGAFAQVGWMREEYFIDHVDKEWCFRAQAIGFEVVISPNVVLMHELGDAPRVSSSGRVVYRHSSPARQYYLTRNAVLMLRDVKLPWRRTLSEAWALFYASVLKLLSGSVPRLPVVLGVVDGVRNRRGFRSL